MPRQQQKSTVHDTYYDEDELRVQREATSRRAAEEGEKIRKQREDKQAELQRQRQQEAEANRYKKQYDKGKRAWDEESKRRHELDQIPVEHRRFMAYTDDWIVCTLCDKKNADLSVVECHIDSKEHKRKAQWEPPADQDPRCSDPNNIGKVCEVGEKAPERDWSTQSWGGAPGTSIVPAMGGTPADASEFHNLSRISMPSRMWMVLERTGGEIWVVCKICEKKLWDAASMESTHIPSQEHTRKLANALSWKEPKPVHDGTTCNYVYDNEVPQEALPRGMDIPGPEMWGNVAPAASHGAPAAAGPGRLVRWEDYRGGYWEPAKFPLDSRPYFNLNSVIQPICHLGKQQVVGMDQ